MVTSTVSGAIAARFSCRAFDTKNVATEVVENILSKAARAPSGGNLQPWKVYVVRGNAKDTLIKAMIDSARSGDAQKPEYYVYPDFKPGVELEATFKQRRRRVGEQLYRAIGIDKKDKARKMEQLLENFKFFGAPVGMIVTLPRSFNKPQWSDVGMFLQNLTLLAVEQGLATICMEAWAQFPATVKRVLTLPDDEVVFCAVALGYPDHSAAINSFRTERTPVRSFATFLSKL